MLGGYGQEQRHKKTVASPEQGPADEAVVEPEPVPELEHSVSLTKEPVEPVQEPKNSVENSVLPKILVNFPGYIKPNGKRRGRQRAKDKDNADNGVRQLFELWWDEGKGQSFTEFFKDDLSDDMCAKDWGYYPKHFIAVKGKSHAEYVQWRREWRQKFGRKFGSTEFSGDTGATKIIQISNY